MTTREHDARPRVDAGPAGSASLRGSASSEFWARSALIYLAALAAVFAGWYTVARIEYRDALNDWRNADAAYRGAWRQETDRQRADEREAWELAQKDWRGEREAAVAKVLADGGTQQDAIRVLDDPERWKNLQERLRVQQRTILDGRAADRVAFLPSPPGSSPTPPDVVQIVVGAALSAFPVALVLAWALPRRRRVVPGGRDG